MTDIQIRYYPLESCPARIMHGYDLMSNLEWDRANGNRFYGGAGAAFERDFINPVRKKAKPLTQEQKDRKRRRYLEWMESKRKGK